MITQSNLRELFEDISVGNRVQADDFRALLASAAGANRLFNRAEFINFATDVLGLAEAQARAAFSALAAGSPTVRASDLAAYLGSFDRDGDGLSFVELRRAVDGMAAGVGLLAAPGFAYAPATGQGGMGYASFSDLALRAGLADAALLRAVFADAAGADELLGCAGWLDLFGAAALSRDAFRNALLARGESLGFAIFDRAAGNGRLSLPEFVALARRVGLDDLALVEAAYDLIAGTAGYVGLTDWTDVFGSPIVAPDTFLTLVEELADAQMLVEFGAYAGNGRLGLAEFEAAALAAGLTGAREIRSVFDLARGTLPYLTPAAWREAFGAMSLTPTRFADAYRSLLADRRIDLRDFRATTGWTFSDFAEAVGDESGYDSEDLETAFALVAGGDGVASNAEVRSAFGGFVLQESELVQRIDGLFDRLLRVG